MRKYQLYTISDLLSPLDWHACILLTSQDGFENISVIFIQEDARLAFLKLLLARL
jgi:hypothetical protein